MKLSLFNIIFLVFLIIKLSFGLELLKFNERSKDWDSISSSEGAERIITNCYLKNHQTILYKVNLNEPDDHLALIQITHNQFINSNQYYNEYENIIVKSYTFVNHTNDENEMLPNINNKTNTMNNDKIEISITDITPVSINSCFEKEIFFSIYLNNYFFGGDIEVSVVSLYDKTQCYIEKKNKKSINTFIKRF